MLTSEIRKHHTTMLREAGIKDEDLILGIVQRMDDYYSVPKDFGILQIEAQWQPSERQFFAAHAMQGILARSLSVDTKLSPDIQGVTGLLHNYEMNRIHFPAIEYNKHGDKVESYGELVAREALAFSDAMIAVDAMIKAANKSI